MKTEGITTERTVGDVTQKILVMEQNFKKTINFLDGTGAGITDKESLVAAVRKICPNYYNLEPVMSDGQSSRPLATEEDISLGETDNKEEEKVIESNNQEEEKEIEPEIEYSREQKEEELASNLSPMNLTASKRSNSHLSIKGHDQSKKLNSKAMDQCMSKLTSLKREQLAFDQKYKSLEVKQKHKEMYVCEKEANAWVKEAESKSCLDNAMVKKMEAETRIIEIEAKAQLLMKRKELLDAGIAKEDIEKMLLLK